MSTSTLTAVLAAAFLATGVGSAAAASAGDPVSMTVNYSDLNLSTQDGAKAVLQRIGQAARRVCKPDADIANLPGLSDWNNVCVSTRVKDAVSRLDAPLVTAAYQSRVFLAERGTH